MKPMIVMLMILIAQSAYAEIYRWVDNKGVIHFSNVNPPAGIRMARITPEYHSLPAPFASQKHSSEDAILVSVQDTPDYTDVYVQNRKDYDVTVTFHFEFKNMTLLGIKSLTDTYAGNTLVKAFRLLVVNKREKRDYRYHYDAVRGSMYAVHDDRHVYALPYLSGASYRVTQSFNGKYSHFDHAQYAVDFGMQEGTTVCAAREGKVVGIQKDVEEGGPTSVGPGNFVLIQHSDKTLGEYYHLMKNGVLVEIGQYVAAGTPIAVSGNTGRSTSPHLHFGVYSAIDGKRKQSHPIMFQSRQGIVSEPIQGKAYTAD